jgi:hypothetical protein
MAGPEDLHEYVSFEDEVEDRTWVFDLTFLTSSWRCIFGAGCPGVLTGPAPELEHGCCSYGAHFTDADDRARTEAKAAELTDAQWQHRRIAARRGGPIKVNAQGEAVTRMVDGACIFLNRPGFDGGAGCALHRAALDVGERHIDWKPDVCWQLPLRRHDETDAHGHVTSTLREWKRRDWGEGGLEFHWWCTDDPQAFVAHRPVYVELSEEIVELVGARPYAMVVAHIERHERLGRETFLPHPALRPART